MTERPAAFCYEDSLIIDWLKQDVQILTKARDHYNEIANRYQRAFAESHRLLQHYAELLNSYDGGQRDIPKDIGDWMDRLTDGS